MLKQIIVCKENFNIHGKLNLAKADALWYYLRVSETEYRQIADMAWRIDRVAKELAWKASKV